MILLSDIIPVLDVVINRVDIEAEPDKKYGRLLAMERAFMLSKQDSLKR